MKAAISLTEYSLSEARYTEQFVERGYLFDKRTKWATTNASYEKFEKSLESTPTPGSTWIETQIVSQTDEGAAVLYRSDQFLGLLEFNSKSISVSLSGNNWESIDTEFNRLQKIFPPLPEIADRVRVKFWYNTANGPAQVTRQIVVPNWKSIRKNYESKTLKNLEYLMNDFRPSGGGQLIIFNGPPGTGKSYSLRALLDAWKDWCVADYILDPENLFSGNQGYMASLVLRGASDTYEFDPEEEDDGILRSKEGDKWKLLILEDSGELLSADAKSRTGQGLSRLLNLVDGLIGQGLRVLVLITTNEDLEKLHPAVSREGRCAAAVKFRTFDYRSALKWLEDKTSDTPSRQQEYTLADLYGFTRGKMEQPDLIDLDLKQVGFQLR